MIPRIIAAILTVSIVFILITCSRQSEEKVVAMVGNLPITAEEFELNYQFNPYLAVVNEPQTAKFLLLKNLVVQKMMAAEGYARQADQQESTTLMIDQYHREAMIEDLWQKEIDDFIQLSRNEVYQAYLKSKRVRFYQYLMYESYHASKQAFERINDGIDFKLLAEISGIDPSEIPTDSISFGSELVELENLVFQMKPNEVSAPLKIGPYFFIIKYLYEKQDLFTNESDFDQNYRRLSKALRKRKRRENFKYYVRSKFDNPPYILDKVLFKQVVQQLEEQIVFTSTNAEQRENFDQNKNLEILRPGSEIESRLIVRFSGEKKWTVQTLLQRLRVSPYPIEFSTPGKFRSSMIAATKMVLDDQVLVDLAQKAGLENSLYVKTQTQIWQDHLIYQKMLTRIYKKFVKKKANLSAADFNQNLDDFLVSIATKYPVQINHSLLDTLSLSKTDMVVMKSHFPKRTIIPLSPLYDRLPKFEQKIFRPDK